MSYEIKTKVKEKNEFNFKDFFFDESFLEIKHIKFLLKQLNVIMIIGEFGKISFGYVGLNSK